MTNFPDTYGWDTVFAISIDRANLALRTVAESPSYSASQQVTGGTATVDWTFKNWRITDTPGGNSLVLSMDFGTSSRLTSASSTISPNLSLNGWSCSVTVRAHFDDTDPTTQRLRAITAQGQKWADALVDPGTASPKFADIAVVQAVVDDWFNTPGDAVKLFEQEFATVNVGASVGTGPLWWLAPRKLGFAGARMADNVTKALGILAMTARKDAAGNEDPAAEKDPAAATVALSPYAMLPNAQAGFVVSRELVMRNMILASCKSTFSTDGKGLATNFQLSGTGLSELTNVAELQFTQQCDGADRSARLAPGALKASLEGETLTFSLTPMNVDTSHTGFTLDATITEQLQMKLADSPSQPGAKVFLLTEVGGQTPTTTPVMSEGVKIAMGVAGVLAATLSVALAITTFKGPLAAKLSATSAKILARVIAGGLGLIAMTVAMTPGWIELALSGQQHDLPDFAPVLTAGLDGISWPGIAQTKFLAVEGRFANGMLITIDPQFS